MKKIIKILKELVFFLIALLVSSVLIYFILVRLGESASNVVFDATVEKAELRIVSPVFGNIETLPVSEGQLIKKGDPIAIINVFGINSNETPNADSQMFKFDKDKMTVINPEDSIVAKKIFAENTVLKPGVDFLVLYPIKDSNVKFTLGFGNTKLSDFYEYSIKDDNAGISYSVIANDTLPVNGENGQRYYSADFKNIEDSKNFYNGQKVHLAAKRKTSDNTLLSKIMLQLSSLVFRIKR